MTETCTKEVAELRIALNKSLNAHHRNIQQVAKALREDKGHFCESRKIIEAIFQRSWDAIKSEVL